MTKRKGSSMQRTSTMDTNEFEKKEVQLLHITTSACAS